MIYIDLDGTILDVFDRYYGIFNEYIDNYGISINKEEYIYFRQNGYTDIDIISFLKKNHDIDLNKWYDFKNKNLEKEEWLSKDKIIGNLKIIKKCPLSVTLITQRNNEVNAKKQIKKLGLYNIFKKIVILKPIHNGNSKLEYLMEKKCVEDVIIGDSLIELECSRKLGITGVFVKTGLFGVNIVKNEMVYESYMDYFNYINKKYLYD